MSFQFFSQSCFELALISPFFLILASPSKRWVCVPPNFMEMNNWTTSFHANTHSRGESRNDCQHFIIPNEKNAVQKRKKEKGKFSKQITLYKNTFMSTSAKTACSQCSPIIKNGTLLINNWYASHFISFEKNYYTAITFFINLIIS